MKLYLMLLGLLAFVTPAFPQDVPPPSFPCGVDIKPGMPNIIQCPQPNSDNTVCTIPLTCLNILKDNDFAAINVYNGEKVVWISDLLDSSTNAPRKFKFKAKFQRVPKSSSHQECLDAKPGDGEAFDNYPPQNQQSDVTQSAVVSLCAPKQGCFKHSIHIEGGPNPGGDDIDPHIIIGGQLLLEKHRKGSHKRPQPKVKKPSSSAAQH